MVGAVVVKGGQVAGKGFHRRAGGPHAEVNAIDDAGPAAAGATLYVTLEPCNHTGRTPPCTEKILSAGIKKVVVAMDDPNPHVAGGGNGRLRDAGVEVVSGVRTAEAERLNEIFIKSIRTRSPFVLIKCAATLDGRIATRTGDAKWVSGEASRAYVHELRHIYDAILVGKGTVLADDPSLTARRPGMESRDPIRIILDGRLSIPTDRKLFSLPSTAVTLVITGPDPPADRRAAIETTGARIIAAPLTGGRVDLNRLMPLLGEMGITSLLIEGGGGIIGSAFAAGVADKVNFFFAPRILGGDDGIPVCRGTGPARMADAVRLGDISVRRFGEDVMIEGYPVHPARIPA
jgi:diaminohydroxyphosphoribosylaminopyrimidine deaminase/5-amino-6-(5-phosphoribosylamino)uracil reductase